MAVSGHSAHARRRREPPLCLPAGTFLELEGVLMTKGTLTGFGRPLAEVRGERKRGEGGTSIFFPSRSRTGRAGRSAATRQPCPGAAARTPPGSPQRAPIQRTHVANLVHVCGAWQCMSPSCCDRRWPESISRKPFPNNVFCMKIGSSVGRR